jgi:hypothetical protein
MKTLRKKQAQQIPHFQKDYPLRLVSRLDTLSGKSKPRIPLEYQSTKYWPMLLNYLMKLNSTLERLKPFAAKAVTSSNNYHRSKTIVVMVCNFGQSELFVNFVCSARARNIDLSNILLFATDPDMYQLAHSLHITTFDVQDAFGDLPTGAANKYGDRVFQGMMFSKVYCVHLISVLGYDVLFQDVDVVWYRNPIEYFQSEQSGNFDMYFQDGAYNEQNLLFSFFNFIFLHLFCLITTFFFTRLLRRWCTFNTIYTLLPELGVLLCTEQRTDQILFRSVYAVGRSNYG